jgi:hypothetical protein
LRRQAKRCSPTWKRDEWHSPRCSRNLQILLANLFHHRQSREFRRGCPKPLGLQRGRGWGESSVLSTLAPPRSEDVGQPVRLALCRRDDSHHVGKTLSMDAPALRQREGLVAVRLGADKRADLIKDASDVTDPTGYVLSVCCIGQTRSRGTGRVPWKCKGRDTLAPKISPLHRKSPIEKRMEERKKA